MTPIIHVKYDDDGCNFYKCLSCKGEVNLRTHIQHIKYCPYCGTPVYFKEFKNERKQRVIDAYNRRFPNNKIFDWSDLTYHQPHFEFPKSILSVSIVCLETREYMTDVFNGVIEVDVDKNILITYNKIFMKYSGTQLKDYLYNTVLKDWKYFKNKYEETIKKDTNVDLFDEYASTNRLINYKLKIEIEKE